MPHLIRRVLLPVYGQPAHGPKDVPQDPLVEERGFGQGPSRAIQNPHQNQGVHEGVGVVRDHHERAGRHGPTSAFDMEEDPCRPSEEPGEESFSLGHFGPRIPPHRRAVGRLPPSFGGRSRSGVAEKACAAAR